MGLAGSAGPSVGDTWEAALKLHSLRFLAMLDLFFFFSVGFLRYATILTATYSSGTTLKQLTKDKGQESK